MLGGGWSCLGVKAAAAFGTTRCLVEEIAPALRQHQSALERLHRSHGLAGRDRGRSRQLTRIRSPGGRRGDEHAPGSVWSWTRQRTGRLARRRAAPTADIARASNMIESVSPSAAPPVSDKTSTGGGSCPHETAVVLDVAVMAPMTRPESKGPHSMVSGSSSEPTGLQPQDDRARLTGFAPPPAWAKRESPGVTAAGSS